MLNTALPLPDIFRFGSVEEQYLQGCGEGGMMEGGLCKLPIKESGANDLGFVTTSSYWAFVAVVQ